MCDYSLFHVKSRAANVDDKLEVHMFTTGSRGFVPAGSVGKDSEMTAVCVLPGTELAFDESIKTHSDGHTDREHKVARFRQVDLDKPHTHHDALELPDGEIIKLGWLSARQIATVLQLPAAPKNDVEAQEQKRLEVVG